MLGKKILAVIFAALTLIKLAFMLVSPERWLGASQAFMAHTGTISIIVKNILK